MASEREIIAHYGGEVEQLRQAVADAEFWHDHWLGQSVRAHQQARAAIDATRDQALAQAEARRTAETRSAEERCERAQRAASTAHDTQVASARAEYQTALDAVRHDLRQVATTAGLLGRPWSDAAWRTWNLGTCLMDDASGQPLVAQTLVRLGELGVGGRWDRFATPALLPVIGGRGVMLKAEGDAKARAALAAQALALRLLVGVPPGKLLFTFIDPVGLGQNVSAFMNLAEHDENLISSIAWTTPEQIDRQLRARTEDMTLVLQKNLTNRFTTIEEYNRQAPVLVPYRVLVVLDFPTNFTENAARDLVRIAQNGPRCGVYPIIHVDTQKPMPYGFDLGDLERHTTVIAADGATFRWQGHDFAACDLGLDQPPPVEVFNRLLDLVGAAAKGATKVEVPFARIAPKAAELWQGDSADGFSVPLGPRGAHKFQYLDLSSEGERGMAPHVLVVGKAGSGKGVLFHTLITGIALRYSPLEAALYLIDMKDGVEFKPYAAHHLPHARVIAIESEREFALSALREVVAELRRRGEAFRLEGVNVLAAFRAKTGRVLPRIMVIIDEFQRLFEQDDTIAAEADRLMDSIVREGRYVGIHLVLATQGLAGAYNLPSGIFKHMGVRIALPMNEADAPLVLGESNLAARYLSRPGEAIYNGKAGDPGANDEFQVAIIQRGEKQDNYLTLAMEQLEQPAFTAYVAGLIADGHYLPERRQIVFENKALAHLEDNRVLAEHLALPGPSQPRRVYRAWLGDPITIKDEPAAAPFARQSGSNLLVVGRNEEVALATTLGALLSLAGQLPVVEAAGDPPISVLNFPEFEAPHAAVLPTIGEALPEIIRCGGRESLTQIVGNIAAEVERRQADPNAAYPPVFLVIFGIQRPRDLRRDDDFAYSSFSLDGESPPPSPAKQLQAIVRDGPDLGVYSIVWCDSLNNLDKVFDSRTVREFATRVVFEMSNQDSNTLIDSPLAERLGPYRALLYNAEQGRVERFRPYTLPSTDWLVEVTAQLKSRAGALAR